MPVKPIWIVLPSDPRGHTIPIERERSEAHRCDPRVGGGGFCMDPCLYPILHPGSKSCSPGHKTHFWAHTKSASKGGATMETELIIWLPLFPFPRSCRVQSDGSHSPPPKPPPPPPPLHDIKAMLGDTGVTLTYLLILPRCQTHFQAVSRSQLVKVCDNRRAPLSSQMLSRAHAGQEVQQQQSTLPGGYDIFGLPAKLITRSQGAVLLSEWKHCELKESWCIRTGGNSV